MNILRKIYGNRIKYKKVEENIKKSTENLRKIYGKSTENLRLWNGY